MRAGGHIRLATVLFFFDLWCGIVTLNTTMSVWSCFNILGNFWLYSVWKPFLI